MLSLLIILMIFFFPKFNMNIRTSIQKYFPSDQGWCSLGFFWFDVHIRTAQIYLTMNWGFFYVFYQEKFQLGILQLWREQWRRLCWCSFDRDHANQEMLVRSQPHRHPEKGYFQTHFVFIDLHNLCSQRT